MTLPASGPLTLSDIQTEFGGTNPIGMNEYYAGGGLVPAGTSGTYGAVPSSGALSVQNFYGTSAVIPAYIEEVFSTYVYSGTSSVQTITNNVDLSTNGGLVWIKKRNGVELQQWWTTVLGNTSYLRSNGTQTLFNSGSASITYNTTGFSLNTGSSANNQTGDTYAGWTFRKKPKFFDVVTGVQAVPTTTINHNLGSVPGLIIVKNTNNIDNQWYVYHRSLGTGQYLTLETTDAASSGFSAWGGVAPTSTQFTIGYQYPPNTAFVAYLFAHDAGGFGLTGTDNVISCGGFTKSGSSDVTVNLGFEPQWILMKSSSNDQAWFIFDTMRGMSWSAGAVYLNPNSSASETTGGPTFLISATGFTMQGMIADASYIYIAIRRGPMKVPTSGTSVFSPVAYSGTGATRTITAGFPVDLAIPKSRGATGNSAEWYTRLIGPGVALLSAYTFQELARPTELTSFASNTGVVLGTSSDSGGTNASGSTYVDWNFRRAPSFFDEVCYTGTGYSSSQTLTHNLSVIPELMIAKDRTTGGAWGVYSVTLGATKYLQLNETFAEDTSQFYWGNTAPTSTHFTVKGGTNIAGDNYVIYLFATCAGVSKCFSYTGNGSSQTINCGFTGGARFVLIKRTDDVGDWYVWDSARGIVSGNDPHLSLNTTAAEVTTDDTIDTDSTGFVVNQVSATNVNVSSATYIGLAIA